ncbi:MAG: Site-specific recombinase XerD [Frankiales bacterium]|nr:Site-specific recombinase XerD [Frankiales bacterium]
MGAYADEWISKQVHLKPSTRSRYRDIVRLHIKPRFGTTPLVRLERSDVTSWVSDLAESPLAAATVNHVFKVFHSILQAALLDGRIARNPAVSAKLPRERGKEKRFLTHDEVARLADAAGDDRLMILVLAFCGLRFGS